MSRPFPHPPSRLETGGTPEISTPHWSGPLALLVDLAQRRRIDLKAVSMVELVDACLASLGSMTRIEDKADQLLLAADLTLMKSRLLLAAEKERGDEEEALRQQALKLQRIQRVAALLMERDQLGREVWPRGAPELETVGGRASANDLSIIEIVRAYARLRLRDSASGGGGDPAGRGVWRGEGDSGEGMKGGSFWAGGKSRL